MAGLKHIAQEANVSEATVSRILREQGPCSPETRQRVLEAAQRLRYRPNMLVRGIQTGRTQTLGVVMASLYDVAVDILEGIHDESALADYLPLLAISGGNRNNQPERKADEMTQLRRLIDRRVDAVIVRPTAFAILSSSLREVWERKIPLVVMLGDLGQEQADFVGFDDVLGGHMAAEHLLSLGYRHIAYLAGSECERSHRDRFEGFARAVTQHGGAKLTRVACPDLIQVVPAVRQLFRDPDAPMALFSDDDLIAKFALEAVRQLGLRIPQDVALMTSGDRGTYFDHLHLSRLRVDYAEMGRTAVRLALERFAHKEQPHGPRRIVRIKPSLIVRQSTDPSA